MTSKHTPGPWSCKQGQRPNFFYIESPSGDVVYVSGSLQPTDCEANARLIAAAPEMLEALIQAAAHLSSGIQTNQGSHEEPPEPASQWDYEAGLMAGDLLRLIAKATGEGA
jgi:hypothetical protein